MSCVICMAELYDLLEIVDMQEAHRQEVTASSDLSFNRELCIENMKVFIKHPLHLIIVARDYKTRRLVGYVWLVIVTPHYSERFYLSEVYTYILPDKRNRTILSRLLNKSKLISRNMGAMYLQYGNFSGNGKLSQAYHKRFTLLGEVFKIT